MRLPHVTRDLSQNGSPLSMTGMQYVTVVSFASIVADDRATR